MCEELEDQLHEAFAGRYRLDWRHVDRDEKSRKIFSDKIPVLVGERGEILSQGRLVQSAVDAYLG